jgi:hypothetical protein
MAARKRAIALTDEWRGRIKASMLVNRLSDHVEGKIELSPTQVRCAEILLRKVAPDLQAVEHSGEVETNYVTRVPNASKTMDEWQSQHADQLNKPTIQ